MFFFVFFFAFFGVFSKVKGTQLLEVRLTDFYNFILHDHSCSKESRCKLQGMKNGFHQNALFTISLQTQVSLRYHVNVEMIMQFNAELTANIFLIFVLNLDCG